MDTEVYASSAKITVFFNFQGNQFKEYMNRGDLERHGKISSFVTAF